MASACRKMFNRASVSCRKIYAQAHQQDFVILLNLLADSISPGVHRSLDVFSRCYRFIVLWLYDDHFRSCMIAEWLKVLTAGIKRFGEAMRAVKLTTKVFGYAAAKNDFLFEKGPNTIVIKGDEG